MKYDGMSFGMWILFKGSFRKNLSSILNFNESEAKTITAKAKAKYHEIIEHLPEFEKGDRFKINIVSCAMFAAFLLSMEKIPSKEKVTEFYNQAMMTKPMRWFCRMSGKNRFAEKNIAGLKQTAASRAGDRNPYSWNMDLYEYKDGQGYEARFTQCGICTLMRELGLFEYVPALCKLDYTMNDASGVSDFIRQYTLAKGGPYCDCGYRKRSSLNNASKSAKDNTSFDGK